MQVQTVWEAGSERRTWRRFLLQTTLLLTILLAGGATICWVAANWPEWTRVQRLASTQGLLISVALAGLVALQRTAGRAPGGRRSGVSALLGLACVVLGALLALVGQTYQTGANTATLFFLWAALMLPWALAALSPSVWLLFFAVVNTGITLYFKIFYFSVAFGLPEALSFWQIPVNLGFLTLWSWFARGEVAHARIAPRLLAGIAIAAATSGVLAYHPSGALYSSSTLIWLWTMAAMWAVYRRGRYDSAVLAMTFVSAVFLAMYAIWQVDTDSWELTFLACIVLFLGSGAWGGAWLRRSAAQAPLPHDEDAAWDRTSPLSQRHKATVILGVSTIAVILLQVFFYDFLMSLGTAVPDTTDGTPAVSDALRLGWAAAAAATLIALFAAFRWMGRHAAQRTHVPTRPIDASTAPTSLNEQPVDEAALGGALPDGRRSVAAMVLSTASAWLSSFFLLFLLGASSVISEELAGVWGVGLVVVAIVILKGSAASVFLRQCAVTLGFAGLLLLSVDVFFIRESGVSGVLLLLAFTVAAYVLARDAFLRFLTSWVLAAAITWLLLWYPSGAPDLDRALHALFDTHGAHALSDWTLITFVLAAVAVLAFLFDRRTSAAWQLPLQPLGWGFALAAVALCVQSSSVALTAIKLVWALHPGTAVFLVLAGCLPALAAVAVMFPLRRALPLAMRIGVPVGLLVLGLLWLPSPGVTLGLTWMILGFGLRNRMLLALGTLSLVAYLVFYYYQLGVPLLDKAVWLGLGGLASCLFYGLLVRAQRRDAALAPSATVSAAPSAPARPARVTLIRQGLTLAGLLLILGVVNLNIWQKEQLIAHGREVRLVLAPVDPRSLMQGDYMTLDFQATRQLSTYLHDTKGETIAPGLLRTGYAILRIDEHNVAQFVRAQVDPSPLDPDHIAVRYRDTASGLVLLTNGYFFAEGRATHFEASRFGVLRVDDKGNALLTGMQDEKGTPL